jgi:receptor expression-enhancing protein 1/2/3/4
MFSGLQHLISLIALYLYPSYCSYKALNSKNVADAQEWLCYWVVSGILTIPLLISNSILNWIPFYYEIKLLLCLWLIFPKTKGHLTLFNNYVIPYMDRFSGRIDAYAQDVTVMSKKYAGVAWQKGLQVAQAKFFEVLAKGPSALFDFNNISLNFGNIQNTNDGRIKEVNDDDDGDYSENSYSQKSYDNKSNQMIIKKKRMPSSNSNIKKFNIGLANSNAENRKKSVKRMSNEYDDMNRENNQRSPSFKGNSGGNRRMFSNSPFSQSYSMNYDKEEDDNSKLSNGRNNGKSNGLFMNMMSNRRQGSGGLMDINDIYSSENNEPYSNNFNSSQNNYYEDEDIEENYSYGRGRNSKANQRSMRDNYYDYDYDLTREDDDTITGDDLYNEPESYLGNQGRRVVPKVSDEKKRPDLGYQESFISNFNSFFN